MLMNEVYLDYLFFDRYVVYYEKHGKEIDVRLYIYLSITRRSFGSVFLRSGDGKPVGNMVL